MSTHPRRRLALALTLGAVLTLGATTPAGAAKRPSFLLEGGEHWFTHDVGWFPVVQGPAEIHLRPAHPQRHSVGHDPARRPHDAGARRVRGRHRVRLRGGPAPRRRHVPQQRR